MEHAIFSFVKPSENSMIASVRIARFISTLLKVPILHDEAVAAKPLDVLIIVNGAFAFCKHLESLGLAVQTARRIIWVQNDYTIIPPKATSQAESPFRAAFRIREQIGLPPIDYWTTIDDNRSLTQWSVYVNWNKLTYEPQADMSAGTTLRTLFYYGSARVNRFKTFERYFGGERRSDYDIVVSSPAIDKFKQNWPNITDMPAIAGGSFYGTLASHGLGLYIEDSRSHKEFHSPANRFYEMLGAGLPMVFQPESVDMLARAKIDVRKFVVDGPDAVGRMMRMRRQIKFDQQKMWATMDYRAQLREEVKRYWRNYLRGALK